MNNSTFSVTFLSDPELKHLDIGGRETTFVSSLVGLKDIKGVESQLRVEAWGKLADDLSAELRQGDEVILIGRLQIKVRETEAGVRKSAEVIVTQFLKIGSTTPGATSDIPVTQWNQLDAIPMKPKPAGKKVVPVIDDTDPDDGDTNFDNIPF